MSWGFWQTFMSWDMEPFMALGVVPAILLSSRSALTAGAFLLAMAGFRAFVVLFAAALRFNCNLPAEALLVAHQACSSRPLIL